MADSIDPKPSPTFDFDGKRYDFNSLEKAAKELVNGLRAADTQIRRHKNTLQILEVGRQTMTRQLQDKLKSVKPLNQ